MSVRVNPPTCSRMALVIRGLQNGSPSVCLLNRPLPTPCIPSYKRIMPRGLRPAAGIARASPAECVAAEKGKSYPNTW